MHVWALELSSETQKKENFGGRREEKIAKSGAPHPSGATLRDPPFVVPKFEVERGGRVAERGGGQKWPKEVVAGVAERSRKRWPDGPKGSKEVAGRSGRRRSEEEVAGVAEGGR